MVSTSLNFQSSRKRCEDIYRRPNLLFSQVSHGELLTVPVNLAYFCFFSAGLRIWNEHRRLSSTLIIAPALSNSPQ